MEIPEITQKNKDSIVLIDVQKVKDNQTSISIRGTGFIIAKDGKFITCAHVYESIPKEDLEYLGVAVRSETNDKGITSYKRYKTKLLKLDKENDVALMQIISDLSNFKPVEEMEIEKVPEEGQEVIFIGYPLATELLSMQFGITMTTNKCIISSVKRKGEDGSLHFFLIDTHTNNGSSGSPLFSVKTGKVIGVVSGKISAKIPISDGKVADIPANIGICRPIQYAINLNK
jgi:serine protease Do